LYDRLAPAVLGVVRAVVADSARSEDVAEDVFVEVRRAAARCPAGGDLVEVLTEQERVHCEHGVTPVHQRMCDLPAAAPSSSIAAPAGAALAMTSGSRPGGNSRYIPTGLPSSVTTRFEWGRAICQ
jgi:hypothetical protein